jgi:hypothetical protein
VTRNKSLAESFVAKVTSLQFENAFNPYSDTCPIHDRVDGATIRSRNLAAVLRAALDDGVHSIWIARDLGHRGGRRTGLPLTDEANLQNHARLLGTASLEIATKTPLVTENTARIIWGSLLQVNRRVFLWNVFPLHPHRPTEPLSNRCHNRREGAAGVDLILWLIKHLQPQTIVGIGADAAEALARLDLRFTKLRHPSFGGQAEFRRGVSKLYEQLHTQ